MALLAQSIVASPRMAIQQQSEGEEGRKAGRPAIVLHSVVLKHALGHDLMVLSELMVWHARGSM